MKHKIYSMKYSAVGHSAEAEQTKACRAFVDEFSRAQGFKI